MIAMAAIWFAMVAFALLGVFGVWGAPLDRISWEWFLIGAGFGAAWGNIRAVIGLRKSTREIKEFLDGQIAELNEIRTVNEIRYRDPRCRLRLEPEVRQ